MLVFQGEQFFAYRREQVARSVDHAARRSGFLEGSKAAEQKRSGCRASAPLAVPEKKATDAVALQCPLPPAAARHPSRNDCFNSRLEHVPLQLHGVPLANSPSHPKLHGFPLDLHAVNSRI
jgi:hypothetical protein